MKKFSSKLQDYDIKKGINIIFRESNLSVNQLNINNKKDLLKAINLLIKLYARG